MFCFLGTVTSKQMLNVAVSAMKGVSVFKIDLISATREQSLRNAS